jgi:hypothetical protein
MKGEIGIFSVAEILQMIGMQEKTGVLRIKSRGKSAVLFLESGRVVSARDRRQGPRDPFLFYLHEHGEIGIDALNKIAERKQGEGGDLIEILLNEKVIDEQRLGAMLSQYAVQTLENVVKWETGTYEFSVSSDAIPEKPFIKPMRLEPILMEALRRKDEVEEIRRFLPGFDTRIKIAVPNIEELPLEQEDAAVLSLVNGRRTIDEIIDESDSHEVETLDILERLFALGIVSIAEKEADGVRKPMALPALRSLLFASIIVVVSLVLRFTLLAPETRAELPLYRLRASVEQFVDAREVQNLSFALDAYRHLNGSYPATLDALVADELLTEHDIRDRYGNKYAYMYIAAEDRYVLSP